MREGRELRYVSTARGKGKKVAFQGGRLGLLREALFLMVPASFGGGRDHQKQCGAEKGKVVFQGGRQGLREKEGKSCLPGREARLGREDG